jgi:hypothetical protein
MEVEKSGSTIAVAEGYENMTRAKQKYEHWHVLRRVYLDNLHQHGYRAGLLGVGTHKGSCLARHFC